MKHISDSTKEEITKEWIDYVKNWNKEKFDKYECLGCKSDMPLPETQEYILSCIEDLLEEYPNSFEIPITKTYSAKGMYEFQKLIYLISETEKTLFNDGSNMMTSIIFDAYNMGKHGTKGLLEILNYFVKWKEIE